MKEFLCLAAKLKGNMQTRKIQMPPNDYDTWLSKNICHTELKNLKFHHGSNCLMKACVWVWNSLVERQFDWSIFRPARKNAIMRKLNQSFPFLFVYTSFKVYTDDKVNVRINGEPLNIN